MALDGIIVTDVKEFNIQNYNCNQCHKYVEEVVIKVKHKKLMSDGKNISITICYIQRSN